MSKLHEGVKDCPFCGNDEIELLESHVGFSIECVKCGVYVGGDSTEAAARKLWNRRTSTIGTLKVKLSVIDSEPMSDLVDIIIGYPRDKLPVDLKEQIEGWCDKHTSDED